jgi:maltose O-acetyltransferase
MAPFYLRSVNHRGQRIRTVGGRPRVVNFGYISIGDDVRLTSYNVPIELCAGAHATLRIGNSVNMNYGVSIGATQSIYIGDRVRMGPYVRIVDSDFHDLHNRSERPPSRPVTIHDDAWIGMNAVILGGVTVGRGAVIATGAVVTQDVPPFTVVGGMPARVMKQLDPKRFVAEQA